MPINVGTLRAEKGEKGLTVNLSKKKEEERSSIFDKEKIHAYNCRNLHL
jgi:hypothetical protein